MNSRKRILAAAVMIMDTEEEEKWRKWKCCIRKWITEGREKHNIADYLIPELREEAPSDYRNFLRMKSADFDIILPTISPFIKKQDTNMQQAILTVFSLSTNSTG